MEPRGNNSIGISIIGLADASLRRMGEGRPYYLASLLVYMFCTNSPRFLRTIWFLRLWFQ